MSRIYKPQALLSLAPGIIIALLIGLTTGFTEDFLFILFFVAAFSMNSLRLFFEHYDLRDDGLFIQSGIFAKSRALFLYDKIQDTHRTQSFLERLLGLTSIEVKTISQQPGRLSALSINDANEVITVLQHAKSEQKRGQTYRVHALFQCGVLILAWSAGLPFVLNNGFLSLLYFFFFIGFVSKLLLFKIAFSFYVLPSNLELNYSLFSKARVHIPYYKIQDIHIRRSIWRRLTGLADLIIETGDLRLGVVGKERKDVILNAIPYLSAADAKLLRSTLIRNMGLSESHFKDLAEVNISVWRPMKTGLGATARLLVGLTSLFVIGVILVRIFAIGIGVPVLLVFLLSFLVLPPFAFLIHAARDFFFIQSMSYASTQDLFIFKRGIFTTVESATPYRKIQNVFVDEDIYDKLFGLWDVHFSTIGKSSQELLHLDGLKKDDADRLTSFLLEKIRHHNP